MAARFRYSKILVGTDFSTGSNVAVARAIDLAERLDAEVEIVHVTRKLEPSLPWSPRNRAVVKRLQRDAVAAAREKLERIARGIDQPTKVRVLVGVPHQALLEHARKQRVNLIVLAKHGSSLRESLLIGSVTERVVRKSHVPVVVVPPGRHH